MMRFEPIAKPERFEELVEQTGARWLTAHPHAKRPKDLWNPFKGALADGFRQLCAYSVMYEPVGTVDHFVSWDEDRTKAYAWSNYRFASSDLAPFVAEVRGGPRTTHEPAKMRRRARAVLTRRSGPGFPPRTSPMSTRYHAATWATALTLNEAPDNPTLPPCSQP